MSVLAMTWAWGREVGHPAQKLVLMALADHANDRGLCHPGIDRIAAKVELAPRTVRRYLGKLAEDGHIQRRRRRRKNGTLGTYQYRLRIPKEMPDQRPSQASGRIGPVAVSDQWPSQVSTSGLSSGRAEPSVEPSVKQSSSSPPKPPLELKLVRDDEPEEEAPGPNLAEWLGESVGGLEDFRGRKDYEPEQEGKIFQLLVSGGTADERWRTPEGGKVPPPERPAVLSSALAEWAVAKGWFTPAGVDGFLRSQIGRWYEEQKGGGRRARASPGGRERKLSANALDHMARWGLKEDDEI